LRGFENGRQLSEARQIAAVSQVEAAVGVVAAHRPILAAGPDAAGAEACSEAIRMPPVGGSGHRFPGRGAGRPRRCPTSLKRTRPGPAYGERAATRNRWPVWEPHPPVLEKTPQLGQLALPPVLKKPLPGTDLNRLGLGDKRQK
jgi:hypothetical protein